MNQESSPPTTQETEKKTFDAMPLSQEVRKALADMAFEHPTEVQFAVWEPATSGRDIVVQARTGTGKTVAFGLPLVDRLIQPEKKELQALVLCPTRELARQVMRELDRLAAHLDVKGVAIYGGAAMGPQVQAMADGAQIVAGTPGRVLDHLRRGTMNAESIRALVLDESDEMLSMGFERELTAILERLPSSRQTLLFSATVPPDIERLAKNRLHEPEFVILSGDQVGALQIDHFTYMVHGDKFGAMVKVLEVEDPESAVIFCNTKDHTERLAARLKREGYDAAWLNGDLAQNEREKVMRNTREGKLRLLVATDVAARGIDISHLTHVINFDFPQNAETYVHRTGRTGRAGRTGTGISLVTPQDIGQLYLLRLTYKIRPLERQLPSQREVNTRAEADIVTGLVDAFAAVGRSSKQKALARRLLSHDQAEDVVAGLLNAHLEQQPDLPELAQSRRRARLPEPQPRTAAPEDKKSKEPKPDRQRRSRKSKELKSSEAVAELSDEQVPAAVKKRKSKAKRGTQAEEERAPAAKKSSRKAESKAKEKSSDKPSDKPSAAKSEPSVEKAERKKPKASKAKTGAAKAKAEQSPDSSAPAKKKVKRSRTVTGDDAPTKAAPKKKSAPAKESSPSDGPAAAKPKAAKPKATKPKAAKPKAASGMELHLSMGRNAGLSDAWIVSTLEGAGLSASQVLRIRCRDHYCFVEVEMGCGKKALDALNASTLDGQAVQAAVSKRRN